MKRLHNILILLIALVWCHTNLFSQQMQKKVTNDAPQEMEQDTSNDIELVETIIVADVPTLNEIIAKHIEAMGGYDVLRSLKTSQIELSLDVQGQKVKLKNYTINDSLTKSEFEIFNQKGYSLASKKEGYSFNPFRGDRGPQKLSLGELNFMILEMDLAGHLVDYAQKGYTVEYIGKELIGFSEYYVIRTTLDTHFSIDEYINTETYLIDKQVRKTRIDTVEQQMVSNLSNYTPHPIGIKYPLSIKSSEGDMKVIKVEFNTPIESSVFKFPKIDPKIF